MAAPRRIPIMAKLLGSAGLLLVLMTIVGLAGVSALSAVAQRSHLTYAKTTEPLADLGVARATSNENRAYVLQHLLTGDAAGKRTIEREMAADDRLVARQLAVAKATMRTAKGRALLARLATDRARWRAIRARVLAASTAGRTDAGLRLYVASGIPALERVAADFAALFDQKVALAASDAQDIADTFHARRTLAFALLAAALLLGFGAAYGIAHGIRRNVRQAVDRLTSLREHCTVDLRRGLDRFAEGDLTLEVTPVTTPIERPSSDELGDVARAVNAVLDNTRASIASYNASRAALADLVRRMSGTATAVSASSQEMAATADESGRAVGEIAHAVGEIAEGAQRQVVELDAARARAGEVLAAMRRSAQDAAATAQAAEQARAIAAEGMQAATGAGDAMACVQAATSETTSAIRTLGAQSEQIGGIVETISGIAEQTNLLALNAAIEAARAGDQGRGFAVVADEVRTLAEGSQQAAASIAKLVAGIQRETGRTVSVVEDGARRTAEGAAVVDRARDAFARIGDAVADVTTRIAAIAAAIEQVSADAGHMAGRIDGVAGVAEASSASTEQVSASTQQTSASAEEIAASAQELATSAAKLEALVGRFRVSG